MLVVKYWIFKEKSCYVLVVLKKVNNNMTLTETNHDVDTVLSLEI